MAANNVNDSQLFDEALPNLIERTDLQTIYTDGGYGSPEKDQELMKEKIEQIQTGIRGPKLNKEKLDLSDFEIKQSDEGIPTQITCPQEQTVSVESARKQERYVAHFKEKVCQACPLVEKCRAKKGKQNPDYHLRFSLKNVGVSQRRRKSWSIEKAAKI